MDYKLDHFQKFIDGRGQLVVFLKNSEVEAKFQKFGQIYFVTFEKPGVVRGNHFHRKWREWFGVVYGKVEVKLKDVHTSEEIQIILDGDTHQYVRLTIGPNVAHAFKSVSSQAGLLNYTDSEWSVDDVFKYNLYN